MDEVLAQLILGVRVAPEANDGCVLKYFDNEPVIVEISRVSKPGCRVYSSIKDLKPIKNGLGISILSTPKGVMSDTAARDANVGGEVLCRVY